MTYSQNNPFARPAADPQEVVEPTHDDRKVTTDYPFSLYPGQDPDFHLFDDDTGRINWTHEATLKSAFTGPGTKNERGQEYAYGVLPPNWPSWVAFLQGQARVATLADEMLAHGERVVVEVNGGPVEVFDWTTPQAAAYLEAAAETRRALEEAKKDAAAAKSYEDPDTGLGFQKLVRDRIGKDFVGRVAAVTRQWETARAVTGRPLPIITGTPTPIQWTIHGLLPRGGSALLVGTYKDDVAARLAAAVADQRPFAGQEVAVTGVVIIDTETPETVLVDRYADALDAGATLMSFRGRAEELDVRDVTVRSWLAQAIGEGSLVIVDSLPTLLGVLDVNDLSADAGGYLSGWTSLVVECKAAGLVMLHDTPQGKPYRARGHGSITQWSDSIWAAQTHNEIRANDHTDVVLKDDAAPDPAKPEKEGGAEATRRRVEEYLTARGALGANTSTVAAAVGLTIPGVTPHLEFLESTGLARREKGKGRAILWYAN